MKDLNLKYSLSKQIMVYKSKGLARPPPIPSGGVPIGMTAPGWLPAVGPAQSAPKVKDLIRTSCLKSTFKISS